MASGQVRIEFRHFAFLGENSTIAARSSECAAQQDLFWEFHDVLFEVHGVDSFGSVNNKRIAEEIGADKKVFDKCLDQGRVQDYVDSDFELGEEMGVGSTPYVFINGRPLKGLFELSVYEQMIEEELGNVASPSSMIPAPATGDDVEGKHQPAAIES